MNAGGAGGNLGGAGGAAGAAGTTGSGCRITASGSPPDVACTGAAWLKPLGGQGGASGSTISWDDGSTLLWPGPAGDPLQPTTSAQPQRVWVDATTQTNRSVPECAPAQGWTIQIRDQGPDGAIRFSVRSGYLLQDPTTDELTALFGVAVETRTNPYCSSEVGNDQGSSVDPCTSTRQDVSDHVIQTTPPQMVTYGILTRITTPNGAFNVRWDSRTTQTLVSGHGFCDCGAQLPVVGFVASRTTN